ERPFGRELEEPPTILGRHHLGDGEGGGRSGGAAAREQGRANDHRRSQDAYPGGSRLRRRRLRRDIVDDDLSRHRALKLPPSGGLLSPERRKFSSVPRRPPRR